MSLPYTDISALLIEIFDREVKTKLPSHLVLTLSTSKQESLARFLKSEPLTKIYVYQMLRDKANASFNTGEYKNALILYNSVH